MINSTQDVRDEVSTSDLQKLYTEELAAINELEGQCLFIFPTVVKIRLDWERSLFETNDAKLDEDDYEGDHDNGGEPEVNPEEADHNSGLALTSALAIYGLFCLQIKSSINSINEDCNDYTYIIRASDISLQ